MNIQRERVRIYPKNDIVNEQEAIAICHDMVDAELYHFGPIYYFINDNENCYDLNYESKRTSKYLHNDIDFEKYNVWIINSDEGGIKMDSLSFSNNLKDGLYQNDPLIYGFDEFRLIGNIKKLGSFISKLFRHGSIPSYLDISNKCKAFYFKGYYQSNNYSDFRTENTETFQKLYNDKFFTEIRDNSGLKSIVCDIPVFDFDNGFYQYTHDINHRITEEIIDENLESVEFYFGTRLIHKIERKQCANPDYDYWDHKSSEWWDCCLSPNWICFKNERKKAENIC